MRTTIAHLSILLTALLSLLSPADALELALPFRDNAVLQQGKDVPVWGWSAPGSMVTVEFAGQQSSTAAGPDGHWMLKLRPLNASAAPAEMLITADTGNKLSLKNILVGGHDHLSLPSLAPAQAYAAAARFTRNAQDLFTAQPGRLQ
jgi:sialate O-acetylesterase